MESIGLPRREKQLWLAGLVALLVGVALVWAAVFAQPDGKLHLWVLDVGQGDALLIESPHGHTMLVDGGPDGVVLLRALGEHLPFWRRQIDMVVLTHPHLDHISGLIAVLDNYTVDHVLMTSFKIGTPEEAEWQRRLAAHNLQPLIAHEGQQFILEPGLEADVEFPPTSLLEGTHSDANNSSVVLRLKYGTMRMLLTGDVETDAVERLLRDARSRGEDLSAQVLKVPHHGSATGLSPALLAAVRPDLALISVGAANSYGHPATQTLTLLNQASVPELRTDQHGAIEVTTDGQSLWVASER